MRYYIGGPLLLICLSLSTSDQVLLYRVVYQDSDLRGGGVGTKVLANRNQWSLISYAYPGVETGFVEIRGKYRSYDYYPFRVQAFCITEGVKIIYSLIKALHDEIGLPTVILEV